jgi:hypothetical protein
MTASTAEVGKRKWRVSVRLSVLSASEQDCSYSSSVTVTWHLDLDLLAPLDVLATRTPALTL